MRPATITVLGASVTTVLFGAIIAQQGCSNYWRLDATIQGPRVAPPGHVLEVDVEATAPFAHQLGMPGGYAADPCVARDATHFHCTLPPGTSMTHDVHIEGKPFFLRIGKDWSPPWGARFAIESHAVAAWHAEVEQTKVLDLPATGRRDDSTSHSAFIYVEVASAGLVHVSVEGITRNTQSSDDPVYVETPGTYRVQVDRPFDAPAAATPVTVTATAVGPCDPEGCAPPPSALRIVSLRAG